MHLTKLYLWCNVWKVKLRKHILCIQTVDHNKNTSDCLNCLLFITEEENTTLKYIKNQYTIKHIPSQLQCLLWALLNLKSNKRTKFLFFSFPFPKVTFKKSTGPPLQAEKNITMILLKQWRWDTLITQSKA